MWSSAGDAVVDVGVGPEPGCVTFHQAQAQVLRRRRNLHVVAAGLQRLQRVVQGGEHRKVGRRAHRARVGREVEEDDGELAPLPLCLAEGSRALTPAPPAPRPARGRPACGGRRAPPGSCSADRSPWQAPAELSERPAEHHRGDGAVQFRDRHHDGGLHRREARAGCAPGFERLELQRLGGDVGHVQPRQHVFGRPGVVIGRAADQREAHPGRPPRPRSRGRPS